MRRRRFLKVSLFSSLGLVGLGGVLALGGRLSEDGNRLSFAFPPLAAKELRCLSVRQGAILRAVALRMLDGAEPSASSDARIPQCLFVDRYLYALDPPIQDDVRHLLDLLEHWPLPRHGRRFTALADDRQDAVLRSWQRSRWDLLRQGFFALKALCCLSHYQDERSFAAIGYSGPVLQRG